MTPAPAGSAAVEPSDSIIGPDAAVLVTGAAGFIGRRVVDNLLARGFRRLRCLVTPAGALESLEQTVSRHAAAGRVQILRGNLLSPDDCARASRDVAVVYHLAAGRSDMFADAFMNSAVTTRNLLRAIVHHDCLQRFVNVSSFSVYSNRGKPRRQVLDESCPVEKAPAERGDPYMYGKAKQDELVEEYGRMFGVPYVTVRPGVVYGPGALTLTNRVGIGTFGLFLHLGGANRIPLTYVDNCAEAIVLSGLTPGVDGEVLNVVDDDLPTSRRLLRLYKRDVRAFRSIYVPHALSYALCRLWQAYSRWSEGQLPPTFNAPSWHAYWKHTRYTNAKLKSRLGWSPVVSPAEAWRRSSESLRTVPRA
jgi:nucleoside-diphosphate-sugar epimerase